MFITRFRGSIPFVLRWRRRRSFRCSLDRLLSLSKSIGLHAPASEGSTFLSMRRLSDFEVFRTMAMASMMNRWHNDIM